MPDTSRDETSIATYPIVQACTIGASSHFIVSFLQQIYWGIAFIFVAGDGAKTGCGTQYGRWRGGARKRTPAAACGCTYGCAFGCNGSCGAGGRKKMKRHSPIIE